MIKYRNAASKGMHNTSRNPLAMLLALLMTASSLSGCLGSDDGSVEEERPDALEDCASWATGLSRATRRR